MLRDGRSRTGWLVSAIVGVLVLAGVAYGASVTTKSKTKTLPPDGAAHDATAKCSSGKVTGGGVKLSDPVNDLAQASHPAGKHGWRAGAYRSNLQSTNAKYTVFARCLDKGRLSTKTKLRGLPSDGNAYLATVKCPLGTKPAGGGAKLTDETNDFFQGTYPSGERSWTAVAASGFGGTKFAAQARCLKGHDLVRKSKSRTLLNDDLAHAVTAKCPRGTKVTGGGVKLKDATNDFVVGTYPVGKRRWTAVGERYSGNSGNGKVTAFAVCLQ
jgi:hypothetical protein